MRPPFALSIGSLIPLLVGAGWTAAPFVSSRKTAQTIKRAGAAASHLAAVAAVFAAGIWAYRTRTGPAGGADAGRVLVYMLVPLLQAVTLTVAGAVAKSGERPPLQARTQRPPATTRDPMDAGRARDESDQKGEPHGRHERDP